HPFAETPSRLADALSEARKAVPDVGGVLDMAFLEPLPGSGAFIRATEVGSRIQQIPGGVPGGVDETRRVVVRVEVAMQARRGIDRANVTVLVEESSELGIEVAGFGVVEARLFVPDVAGEGEAVLGGVELDGEAEVAPGVEVVTGDG